MKKRLIMFMAVMLLMVGCTKTNGNVEIPDKEPVTQGQGNVDVYISANGELIYGEASILEDEFDFVGDVVRLGVRENGDIISEMTVDSQDEVYCSISTTNGMEFGNEVYVVKKNEIKNIIQLEKGYGANTIIKNEDEIFVQGAIRPALNNPEGVPFVSIDTVEEQWEKAFSIKGVVSASQCYQNNIYMIVAEAEKIGYEGFSQAYMAKYDLETKRVEIINENVDSLFARSMDITDDGMICVIDTPMFSEEDEVSILYIYDTDGNLVKKYKLDNWADKIIVNDQNIAYISHRGVSEIYDDAGTTLTVFDLNEGEVKKKITVSKGPSDMFIYQKYLFVSAYTDSAVDAINMETNEVIGTVYIDSLYKIDQVVITQR